MAGSYNRIVLVGNLTRDPEIRYIASGAAVTKFSLAVNTRRKAGEETMFIDIVAWDKLGEICNTYLKKGMNTLIEGRLSIRKYETKEGEKRTAVEVVASDMQMLGSRGDGASGGSGASSGGSYDRGGSSRSDETEFNAASEAADEEIPF
ncbi:MAG TPA: single-stranded DNA-binding protein [Candidatus Baltobacteraceae bacterium]|jgi:single-strand DNA-binding protein|nr:single-stranded DNA-binding protein [Candidatus Baltobacteraceae bacterium]